MVPHKLGYRHLQIDMRVITQDVTYIYIYIYKYLQALVYICIYKYFEALPARRPCIRPYRIIYGHIKKNTCTYHIHPSKYTPLFESQLPRYGNVNQKKKIRGSEPREQVRTARRGSRNPQGRTLFSMTGSRFYLLDFLRSKSTPVHFTGAVYQ